MDSFQSSFDRVSLMVTAEMPYTFSIGAPCHNRKCTQGRQCQSVALLRTNGVVSRAREATVSVLIKLIKGLVDHVNRNRGKFPLLSKLPDKVVARHCWGRD